MQFGIWNRYPRESNKWPYIIPLQLPNYCIPLHKKGNSHYIKGSVDHISCHYHYQNSTTSYYKLTIHHPNNQTRRHQLLNSKFMLISFINTLTNFINNLRGIHILSSVINNLRGFMNMKIERSIRGNL